VDDDCMFEYAYNSVLYLSVRSVVDFKGSNVTL